MTGEDPLPDLWTSLDFPVLRALVLWHTDSSEARLENMRPEGLAQQFGGDERTMEVRGALERLLADGYIKGAAIGDHPYDYIIVTEVTPKALRKTGAWPNEDRAFDVLISSLEEAANRLDDRDPEKAGRLRQAIGWIADGVRTVGTDVLTRWLSQQAGLP